MRAVDIIAKKRDGLEISEGEIRWFIDAYTRDEVTDYQAAAWAMATVIRGMNHSEVTALTMAMAESGDLLDLSAVAPYVVDKHSSGGVGDKTSLVVLPLVAACGVPVAKMSGRGLGLTGGTLDKIESIPGFSSDLSEDQLIEQARTVGIALAGQTRELAPADGKLYALRDVTATVASIPLIASSIMSKKIAAGANGIVLDVKVGSGAFMRDLDMARELAETMVTIGVNVGRDMVALISDMDQPLGQAVGNALEVREAIETLKGGGPDDFREHCLVVASHMVHLARQDMFDTADAARSLLEDALADASGLAKFREMIVAQGGDGAYVDDPSKLAQSDRRQEIHAKQSGWVSAVNAESVALAAFELGAGRERKSDPIDLAVGVETLVNIGEEVEEGQLLAVIHANDENRERKAEEHLHAAITLSSEPVEPLPLFYDTLTRRA